MLLTLPVTVIMLGDNDVSNFYGVFADDLFVQFYQLSLLYFSLRDHYDS